ncbi:MAG: thiamine/thiamine pyrophosphate ABC transporter permease ThiP [Dongiaceae bacterium]
MAGYGQPLGGRQPVTPSMTAPSLSGRPVIGIAALGRLAAFVLIAAAAAILIRLLNQVAMADLRDLVADRYLQRVAIFTTMQAALSTLLATGLAVPVARALARQSRFPGRALLLRLFSLPLVMPSLVAIFGIVAAYGQQGALARLVATTGLGSWPSIYGLAGILLAHVFFNLPLAVRLMLPAWQSVPAETWRLAAQLGMRSGQIFRLIELPLLRRSVPQIAATIFMLCFVSFAIILTLGGGPRASTLEVAIFQAIRFDADLPRAGLLAVVELILCLTAGLFCRGLTRRMDFAAGLGRPLWRPDAEASRIGDGLWILLAALFVGLPEAMLLIDGLRGITMALPWSALLQAAVLGLSLSLIAGFGATFFGFILAAAAHQPHLARRGPARRLIHLVQSLAGLLPLALSPMVLGMGLYLLITDLTDSNAAAILGIILLNGAMAIPFSLALLMPAVDRALQQHDRLCRGLGIAGFDRFRLIDWPSLRPHLATSFALATSLSLGDLVGISLFGNPDLRTLSMLLYEQLSAYRMDQAAATALLLLVLVLVVYGVIERLVGGKGSV